jgi:hypothetical protein
VVQLDTKANERRGSRFSISSLHLRGESCDEFLELGEASHDCDGDQLLISQMVRPDLSLQLDRYERQNIDQLG